MTSILSEKYGVSNEAVCQEEVFFAGSARRSRHRFKLLEYSVTKAMFLSHCNIFLLIQI
jgi:hypothetical protein